MDRTVGKTPLLKALMTDKLSKAGLTVVLIEVSAGFI